MHVAFSADYEELVFPPAADQRVQLRVRWRLLRTELTDGANLFARLDPAVARSKCPHSRRLLDDMLSVARTTP